MSKIDQKKREKKEALLLSAFELFTEKGIQNTSISEIVKRAKMAKGTFYLYFKDKFDILSHHDLFLIFSIIDIRCFHLRSSLAAVFYLTFGNYMMAFRTTS